MFRTDTGSTNEVAGRSPSGSVGPDLDTTGQLLLPWAAPHYFRARYMLTNSTQFVRDYLGFKTESPVFWKPS